MRRANRMEYLWQEGYWSLGSHAEMGSGVATIAGCGAEEEVSLAPFPFSRFSPFSPPRVLDLVSHSVPFCQ